MTHSSLKKLSAILLSVSLALMVLWTGCSFDSSQNPADTTTTSEQKVKTTLAGQVVDESGNPLAGAAVSAGGKTVTTSKFGLFVISDVDVTAERCVVKASKGGYFDSFRAQKPVAGNITDLRIGLMKNTPQGSFSVGLGKTVTAPGSTATVTFPATGYVDAKGNAYNGSVNYVVRYLDPTANNFYDFFDGDFHGVRTDGSFTEMMSYGVLRVELSGASGEKLNLAPGSKATLKYPIPAKMQAAAPVEMPLWYFDESKGMWKEDGSAQRNGNFFEGTVTHFTPWNVDVPIPTTILRVKVLCGNEPVGGIFVRVGQALVRTGADGTASLRVPEAIPFTVKVHPENNEGFESDEIKAGPFTGQKDPEIVVPLNICPAYIIGRLTGCDFAPLAGAGTILAQYPDGGFSYGFVKDGQFKVRVRAKTLMNVIGIAADGRESEVLPVAPPLEWSEVRDIGSIAACNPYSAEFTDIELNVNSHGLFATPNAIISKDGSRVFVSINGSVRVYDAMNTTLLHTITTGISQDDSLGSISAFEVSDDATSMLARAGTTNWVLYDVQSGKSVREFRDLIYAHLSPDGKQLIGVRTSGTTFIKSVIQLYNTEDGSLSKEFNVINSIELTTVHQLTDYIGANRFGVVLQATGSSSKTLYTVNIADGSVVNSTLLGTGLGKILNMSNDGTIAGVDTYMSSYTFYNTLSGTRYSSVKYDSVDYYRTMISVAPSNDRYVTQLRSSGMISAPAFFLIGNSQFIKALPTPVDAMFNVFSFNGDGKRLAGIYQLGDSWSVRIWNIK